MLLHVQPRAHLRLVGGPGLKKARAHALDSRLGEIIVELGRMADQAAGDEEAFVGISLAADALGRVRKRLRER